MALSLTLSAVSAEEDAVADDFVAADDSAVTEELAVADDVATVEEAPAIDESAAGGEDVAAEIPSDVKVVDPAKIKYADVETQVKVLEETPYSISWGITVVNHGPDVAKNTATRISATENMLVYDLTTSVGKYYTDGVWEIGDLAPGDIATLIADVIKTGPGPYIMDALTVSDSFDPILSNNYATAQTPVEPAAASAANEKTMPAAGNPIAMALLALIAILGTTISRRF